MTKRTITFEGFEPTTKVKNLLALKVTQIQDESPSDSTINLHLSKDAAQKYSGTFKINCISGPFKSSMESADIEALISDLVDEIRKQVKNWRAHRFEESQLDVTV